MFYKFNQFTQSLGAAAQEISMSQSMNQKAVEPLGIQYEYATESQRPVSAAAKTQTQNLVPNNPRYRKLMEMQTKFLAEDGKLVWQKLPKDMPLYYTTLALVTVGFGLTLYSILKLATPPKND